MRLIKAALGDFNTDTFLDNSAWKDLRYDYSKGNGNALLAVPEFTPVYAPEDAWLARLDDSTVVLSPANQQIDKQWTFHNVNLRQDLRDKLKQSLVQIHARTPDGKMGQELRAINVLRNEMFAGAGYHHWMTDVFPYSCSAQLQFRGKDGRSRYYDPVNAINYWLTNKKRVG